MKMYKENFGFNNFNKKLMLSIFSVCIFFFVGFLSVGFSAFQTSLIMKDVSAEVKLEADTRVSAFSISTITGSASSSNVDYNYNRIYGDIILSNDTSSVTYEVEVVNLGNVKTGIASISGLDKNLTYTLTDYEVGKPIKSEDGQYTLGATMKFYITIKYAEGATITSEQQSFNLFFDFKIFHSVTYHGVPGDENHPNEIIDGADLVINTELTSIDRLKITQDTVFLVYGEHYEYDVGKEQLTVKNVTGDLLLSYRDISYLISLGSDIAFYKEPAYKTNIVNVEFVNYVDIKDAVTTYDLSENQDNSIVGWITKITDTTYNLYVGSVYDIYTTNFNSAFKDMTGIRSISFKNLNTSQSTSFAYTFFNTKVTTLDLSTFNTANATSMADMFGGMTELETLDVSNFNTEKVTSMYYMFGGMKKITNLDISMFNTENVENMGYMFSGMSKLNTLKLSAKFKTGKVVDMQSMFSGVSLLANLDISSFNTSENLKNVSNMFAGCKSLTSLDFSKFTTAGVTNMEAMFNGCSSLTALNLSTFEITNVINMRAMFEYCPLLEELDIRNFDFTNVNLYTNCLSSVSNKIKITVNNTAAETWVREQLGPNVGTIIVLNPDEQTEGTETT